MTGDNSASSTLRPSQSLDGPTSEKAAQTIPDDEVVAEPNTRGLQLALITLALCLSVFLVALDNTIIATAIPKITDQFQSLDDVGWYGSAYLLTTASFQLLFGKFYSFLNIKSVYMLAICTFEIGSLICGVAPSSNVLIVGRALSGLGSAGIFSGALIIVANVVALRHRPLFTGLVGSMYGIASVAGPVMGGALTDKASWRWCFLINLPIGAVTLIVMVLFFKTPPEIGRRDHTSGSVTPRFRRLDPWGTAIFVPAVICVLLALQWGGTKYSWGSARIIALLVVFAVLISIFVGIQIMEREENATVSPRILRQRSILAGTWYCFCAGAGFYILVYFLPIWFQSIKGVSAVKSGIDNLAMILSLTVGTLVAGSMVTVLGQYAPFMILSSVIMPIGAGFISTLTVDSGRVKWIGYQVIFGFGAGLGMQQPFIAAQAVLEPKDVPPGTSLLVFLQTLGGALFVSIGENIFTSRLIAGLAREVPGLDPRIVLGIGATDLKTTIPPQYLPVVLKVYNDALVSTFHIAIVMVSLSIFGALGMEWKSIRGRKVEVTLG
ncbi:major facilitator superfamily domain-containing protein [Mycena metata]|uniref:Major facilitator superfamily domain-containing protein n=1 Tax=Mycena metata TaxID=1033252 RepID=A0AAD7NDH7_9AGAR|nr:major facilitator superfamily domain-containing protein [Mycena metata]